MKAGWSREEVRREVESLATTSQEIVAKPAVGASGKGISRLDMTGSWESSVETLLVGGDVIIQVECLLDLLQGIVRQKVWTLVISSPGLK